MSEGAWNEEFELSDESYSISDIQDFFDPIFRRYTTITDKLPVKI